jgi:hypothetical protein
MSKLHLILIPTLLFLTTLGSPSAYAQEQQEPPANVDEWQFTVIPYLWMMGIEGEVTVGPASADVDAGFDDILDALDFGGQVHLEAQKGKWGLFLDPTYLAVSADDDVSSPRGTFSADIDVDLEAWLVEFGGFYRVIENPVGNDGSRTVTFDVLAGARYMALEAEVDIEGAGPLGLDIKRDDNKDWIDPIVGGRIFYDITEKVSLGLRADIGGFDVGDSSDFAWNILAAIGYDINQNMTLWAGYRHLDVDYDDGSGSDLFVYDVEVSGPMAGLAIHF